MPYIPVTFLLFLLCLFWNQLVSFKGQKMLTSDMFSDFQIQVIPGTAVLAKNRWGLEILGKFQCADLIYFKIKTILYLPPLLE